jgi:hypothetical protein
MLERRDKKRMAGQTKTKCEEKFTDYIRKSG